MDISGPESARISRLRCAPLEMTGFECGAANEAGWFLRKKDMSSPAKSRDPRTYGKQAPKWFLRKKDVSSPAKSRDPRTYRQ